jgi:hypothetical protein
MFDLAQPIIAPPELHAQMPKKDVQTREIGSTLSVWVDEPPNFMAALLMTM